MTNTCDLCKEKVYSLDLIWLTTEDFTPLEGEVLTEKANGLDAVCNNCYGDVIELVEVDNNEVI